MLTSSRLTRKQFYTLLCIVCILLARTVAVAQEGDYCDGDPDPYCYQCEQDGNCIDGCPPEARTCDGGGAPPLSVTITSSASTITAGGYPSTPYTLTATGSAGTGTYTFSVFSGTNLTLSNTSTSTTNTSGMSGTANGTATVLVEYALNGQYAYDSIYITVLKPDNLYVNTDTTIPVSNSYGSSTQRQIAYTIRSGTTTITDPIKMYEGVPVPTIDTCGDTIQTSATPFLKFCRFSIQWLSNYRLLS